MTEEQARRLSRLLWDAREQIEMWADLIDKIPFGSAARQPRQLIWEIDKFREAQGWSPHGFGHESASELH